jgi:exodeoxyribonuclease III
VTFRLLTYNIKRGGRGREASLAAVIAACAPDLVLLQEATHPETVEHLAESAGMRARGCRPGSSLAFLSRSPVGEFRWHKPRWARHAFLEVTMEGAGPTFFGVHLSAVHSNWTERRRLIELRALLEYVQSSAAFPRHVVAGDFNTLASSEVLDLARLPPRLRIITLLTGRRIRWQTIHRMLESGYVDVFRQLHHDDPGHTFPTWDPHLRLDYAFVPTASEGLLRRAEVVRSAKAVEASDHFPLLTEFDL